MKKRPTHRDVFEHGSYLVLTCHRLRCHVIQRGRICGSEFPAQRVGQQVCDESAKEPLLLFHDQLLELKQGFKFMLIEEHAADIHLTPVLILVAPDACRPVVFQSKAKGIDLVVTTGAILALAVNGQALTNG